MDAPVRFASAARRRYPVTDPPAQPVRFLLRAERPRDRDHDGLSAARGILNGVLLSGVLWSALLLAYKLTVG